VPHAPRERPWKRPSPAATRAQGQARSPASPNLHPPLPLPCVPRPNPGAWLKEQESQGWEIVPALCVSLIFLLQGLGLRTDEALEAVRAPKALIYTVVAILAITPLFGFLMVRVPLGPAEFNVGAGLFCCVPTTLTSGVALVGAAGGNATLALLATAATNLIGVVTTPFWLSAILASRPDLEADIAADDPLAAAAPGGDSTVSLDAVDLLLKLLATILAPLAVGKGVRELGRPVTIDLAAKHKQAMGLTANGLLIALVWMSISASADAFGSAGAANIVGWVVTMIALHLVWLTMNAFACGPLGLKLPAAGYRAAVMLSSQKTLPVAVTVLSYLPRSYGVGGLATIPCVVGHMSQLFIDSAVASRWGSVPDGRTPDVDPKPAPGAPGAETEGDNDNVPELGADAARGVGGVRLSSRKVSGRLTSLRGFFDGTGRDEYVELTM